MTSTDTYQLKWHSHSTHLNGSVAGLLRSERFTDVVLCTLDGCQIPAHKFILSSCSVYLSTLLDSQRAATRAGGMLYVVLPSEISTRALKILVEYMYKGETTVSNEVLDTVLKAGEVLKIRGLWRQTEESAADAADTATPQPPQPPPTANATINLQQKTPNKPDDAAVIPKIAVKKDDKLMKTTFSPMQPQSMNRPMFIGPPKLVFIKTTEGNATGLRPIAPKGQTILVAPTAANDSAEKQDSASVDVEKSKAPTPERTAPRVLRRNAERKYGKRTKTDKAAEGDDKEEQSSGPTKDGSEDEPKVKQEPEWDDSSMEEEEQSIADIFHSEINVKNEPDDDVDEELVYSPLTCELCSEVFTVPAAWVRHIEGHALANTPHTRKRKYRSASDDTEETMALLRCDLCQKHFPNPAEWVRHIQSTHTENEGSQNKTCAACNKVFPSHASMLIHMRTHTGERPFVCGLCNKGFNVKSNLLRHLRTLHDQMVSPHQLDDDEPSTSAPPSATPTPARPAVKDES